MTDWFERRNQNVIDSLPAERLLVFSPKEGWEPLCSFLDVPVPTEPFPRVNSRDEIGHATDGNSLFTSDPAEIEVFGRAYIEELRAKAFAG